MLKKCSLCRRSFDKPLFRCWVLKEGWHGYGADPDYKMIVGFKTLALCYDCKEAPIKFSKELLEKSPYMKHPRHPIVLMDYEKELELNEQWLR